MRGRQENSLFSFLNHFLYGLSPEPELATRGQQRRVSCLATLPHPSQVPTEPFLNPKFSSPPKHAFIKRFLKSKILGRQEMEEAGPRRTRRGQGGQAQG